MAILKCYDMSTIDKVKKSNEKVCEIQENQKYSTYTQDNIMLVRTTNVFPENRIVKTLANSSFITKLRTNFIYYAYYNELDYNQLKKLETYELYYRSTIHFTENGLVSSHLYGNFDNQSFIILEPLNSQLDKSDFRNFAGQDTFIKGDVVLSENAILIIKLQDYDILKQQYPEIENFKVVLYKGISEKVKEEYINENPNNLPEFDVNDERAIVETVLIDLGYTPELIGSHYLINSPTSEKIERVNTELGKKYNVLANGKHNCSKEYEEDYEKNLIITEIFNKLLLEFISKMHNIELTETDKERINNYTAYNLVEIIGLDEVYNCIEKFNNTIEKMQELNLLPTSEQLLNNSIPDIYNAYLYYIRNDEEKNINK